MKRNLIKIDWLFYPADAYAVKKHLLLNQAIKQVDVNPINGLSLVTYDETRIDIEAIKRIVAECGYHCRGIVYPRYLVKESR